MTPLAVEKDIVIKRVEGIESELTELHSLATIPFQDFEHGNGWKLAQFHLHRALEGVFNISSHILSRIPGAQATQYREIALNMGECGVVSKEFAETKLALMAKYRNRLVHFYAEIEPKELYHILQDDLPDFEVFLAAIKHVLAHPEQFNLRVA